MSIWTRYRWSIQLTKIMQLWQLRRSRSKLKTQSSCTNSLKETLMVKNIHSLSIKKEKMVRLLQVLPLLWQQMIQVSKLGSSQQMRMVLEPLLAWSSKLIRFKRFKLQQAIFSQKSQSRSARTILEMTSQFLVMLWTKKKRQASLVKKHGMTMTTKMASVHQKSQLIS